MPSPRPFHSVIAATRDRLRTALPGNRAHLTMAPAYRSRPEHLRIEGKPCRDAGVLALLFPSAGEATVLLIERRHDMKRHAGQLAFPGGRREDGETLPETALRETAEEVGLSPTAIELLGPLSPLYIPVSNYCVHPFVGMAAQPPADLVLQAEEVSRVHFVTLSKLAHPGARVMEPRTIGGTTVEVPAYVVDGLSIWGATAMMLAELLEVCAP